MAKCYEYADRLLDSLGVEEMISCVCSLSDEQILNIIKDGK